MCLKVKRIATVIIIFPAILLVALALRYNPTEQKDSSIFDLRKRGEIAAAKNIIDGVEHLAMENTVCHDDGATT
jgi:hypothetical protein